MQTSPPPTEGVASHRARQRGPFSLDLPLANPMRRSMLSAAAPALEWALGLRDLNGVHRRAALQGEHESFVDNVLADLRVRYRVSDADLARIPETGPLVVVANHPFGAIEGIVLAKLLRRRRPDVRLMANYLLGVIPEMRDLLLLVDPFGGNRSAAENMRPIRQAIRWVGAGGALAVFPAGAVAHLNLREGGVTDPPWSATVARIIRNTRSPVLPIYFDGQNSPLFQLLGTIHPLFRTAMLAREVLNKRGATVDVRIGSIIPARRVSTWPTDADAIAYVRRRTFILRHRAAPEPAKKDQERCTITTPEPVCDPIASNLLAADVASLTSAHRLATANDLTVFRATAGEIPNVLREIGRLRELSYRATGEGTGKSIDLDRFDDWYTHLFVWNRRTSQVVGAYRLARTDRVLADRGTDGLYTATLFHFRRALLEKMGPALELGRSFVRPEFQRSYAPLLLLWKGIGRFVVQHPQYRSLFGPVSISNDYHSVSKTLMVQFLNARHRAAEFARLVRPRHPFRGTHPRAPGPNVFPIVPAAAESDDLDELVAEVERDGKGIPVLLRQYLKLGARFLAYNVDPDFSNTLDGLMVVDLTLTDRKLLNRYLTTEGAAAFLAHHSSQPEQIFESRFFLGNRT